MTVHAFSQTAGDGNVKDLVRGFAEVVGNWCVECKTYRAIVVGQVLSRFMVGLANVELGVEAAGDYVYKIGELNGRTVKEPKGTWKAVL